MNNETQVQETQQVSIDTLPMPEYKAARAEGKTMVEEKIVPVDDPSKDNQADGVKAEEKPKFSNKVQQRFDRLTKHAAALEERLSAAERRAQEAEAKANGKAPAKEEASAAPVEGEPDRSKFSTDGEYMRAMYKFMREQERIEEEKQEAQAEHKTIVAKYNERVVEAKTRYDDWEEKVNNGDMQIPQGVGLTVLRMANGPDVAYHLATHPELAAELMQMNPLDAIGRAWEISRELAAAAPAEETEEEEPEAEEVKAVAKGKEDETPRDEVTGKFVTKAPAPIRPVTGGTTKTSVPLDKMDMAAYKKARQAGRVQ